VRESGADIKIEAWDWRYYAEKVKILVDLVQLRWQSDAYGAEEPPTSSRPHLSINGLIGGFPVGEEE
jgi:hypothetical protein